MRRLLIVPAAGRGARLGSSLPKALTPVLGRPMVEHVLRRHAPYCRAAVVVVHPGAREAIADWLAQAHLEADLIEQAEPTGMLDAILTAAPTVRRAAPDRVWITWCDQVGISAATAAALDAADRAQPAPAMALPTVMQHPPYIHFDRDAGGRIVGVRQRREGDLMPDTGESDAGLFSLAYEGYVRDLVNYSQAATPGALTGERSFLPFIPWLAAARPVVTFELADAREARGVNTPEDLAAAEALVRERPEP